MTMADSRLQPQITAAAIEAHFRAGEVAAEQDEGTAKRTECPFLPDTPERHWWTRGYAHMSRALRAVELEAQLKAANAECERAQNLTESSYARAVRLESALKDIVGLMTSMQSLGYFTNPEWQSRLMAAQLALAEQPISQPAESEVKE